MWPGENRCAAIVTVNLNAELFWLGLDSECINMPKTLSLGQYGMLRGVDRILDVLKRKNVRATFFTPGMVAEKYSETVKRIKAEGHEIAALGFAHENMALLTPVEQDDVMKKAVAAIENVTGEKPVGFRCPDGELTHDTLKLIARNGMKYSSNLSDDDRPYMNEVDGEKLLEIPIHWANYDLPYFAFNYHPAFPAGQGRIANYSGVLDNWVYEFDGCREYGLCFVLQVDPATIGSPARIELIENIIDHIQNTGDTWMCTCEDILKYKYEE